MRNKAGTPPTIFATRRLARLCTYVMTFFLCGFLTYEFFRLGLRAWREPALPLLVVATAWLLWLAPSLTLTPTHIRIANAWRIHTLTWPALEGTEKKWGLVLHTSHGDIPVSACPARSGLGITLLRNDPLPTPDEYEGDVVRLSLSASQGAQMLATYRANTTVSPSVTQTWNIPTFIIVGIVLLYLLLVFFL